MFHSLWTFFIRTGFKFSANTQISAVESFYHFLVSIICERYKKAQERQRHHKILERFRSWSFATHLIAIYKLNFYEKLPKITIQKKSSMESISWNTEWTARVWFEKVEKGQNNGQNKWSSNEEDSTNNGKNPSGKKCRNCWWVTWRKINRFKILENNRNIG